jgi:class 3 adenylate cyclase
MQVAVAGVEDIGDAQAVAFADLVDAVSTAESWPVGMVPSMQM